LARVALARAYKALTGRSRGLYRPLKGFEMKVYVLIVDGDALGAYLTREHAMKVALTKLNENEDFTISQCDLWKEKEQCES
jgi:hypothetical protein